MSMNETRLEAIIDAYGAAPERWPNAERAAALALLKRSDRARIAWVEAAALDSLMVGEEPPQPSGDLMGRLQAIGETTETPRRPAKARPLFGGFLEPVRAPAVAAFAAIALAFVAGLAVPTSFGTLQTDTGAPAVVVQGGGAALPAADDDTVALVDSWLEDADEEEFDASDADDADLELAILDLELD